MTKLRSHIGIWLLLGLLILAGCDSGTGDSSGTTPTSDSTPVACTATCTPVACVAQCATGTGIQDAQLAVEPDAGAQPIVSAIQAAQISVWVEMYLLTDRDVINALEDAANRGVDVRVMLEGHPYGTGSVSPQETIAALNAAGVKAQETNPAFQLTHAKLTVIDGKTALISTANYTKTALGGTSSYADRDYIVTDTTPADVQECAAIFTADWNRTTPTLSDPNLVVSPVNARSRLLALIGQATTTLHLEEEEMADPQIIQALIAAAGRGVQVQVVVPVPQSGSADAAGEQQLTQGHAQVTQVSDQNGGLYIHAKIIIVDGKLAFQGSENVSTASLDANREIGVLIANPTVIQQLEATFQQDVASAG